jgi:PKD repeat protein
MTGISKFWWTFETGLPKDSLNANPTHSFVNPLPSSVKYFDVSLKVRSTGGCSITSTSTITVYPQVDATITATKTVICSNNSITFTAMPDASKYFWDYGDGLSGYGTNVATHVFTNVTGLPVVDTVKLTTTSAYSCLNTKKLTITVMPIPLPAFTVNPPTQVYNPAGNNITLNNATNTGAWTWLWKFGDGTTSTAQSPSHTYSGLNIYTVTLIVSNANCSDSVKHTASITPMPPVAKFDSIPSGCAPLYVKIKNTSLNTSTPGTTYAWDFGDGSPITSSPNPTYTYLSPGSYLITLTITGPGGVSTKSQGVTAYLTPKAYFSLAPSTVYVNDESVRFFNLSQNADHYLWEFGDGDTSMASNPFHKYMTEGVFDITLWAYSVNGCSNSWTLSPGVTVQPAGILRFSTVFTPNLNGPIELTSLPTGGAQMDQFFFPPIREPVLNYKLQIFNRQGTLIFESNNINIPWNGYYRGKLCNQGVYIWFVEGKYANGRPFKKTGDITLLH